MTTKRPHISLEGKNEQTENYLRTVQFERPERMPCNVSLMPATWQRYREDLEKIVLEHPRLFPGYQKGSRDFDHLGDATYSERQFVDEWGCTWENLAPGLVGQPVTHPLEDWDALDSYEMPDLMAADDFGNRRDWDAIARGLDRAEEAGSLRRGGGLNHGFMWMRLYYLRGFENLMIDIATGDARLDKLIAMVLENNQRVIDKYLSLGVEFMSFGDMRRCTGPAATRGRTSTCTLTGT